MQLHINGYFYDRIVDKNNIPCRSLLTITKDRLENIKNFDALFIMMNSLLLYILCAFTAYVLHALSNVLGVL